MTEDVWTPQNVDIFIIVPNKAESLLLGNYIIIIIRFLY